ncbi:hypothetical protein ACO0RG_004714 [Hanseniaspora osmophila]
MSSNKRAKELNKKMSTSARNENQLSMSNTAAKKSSPFQQLLMDPNALSFLDDKEESSEKRSENLDDADIDEHSTQGKAEEIAFDTRSVDMEESEEPKGESANGTKEADADDMDIEAEDEDGESGTKQNGTKGVGQNAEVTQDLEELEGSNKNVPTFFFKFNPCFNAGIFGSGRGFQLTEITNLDCEDEEELDELLNAHSTEPVFNTADVDYISKIFEIYYGLYKSGDKNYLSSNDVLPYGVVNKQEVSEKLSLIDLSFEQVSSELDYYLTKKLNEPEHDDKFIFRLQELNNVLNCLKTFQFIQFEEYLGTEFFTRLHEFINKLDGQPSTEVIYEFLEGEPTKLAETETFYKLVIQLLLRGLIEQAVNLLKTWQEKTKSHYISNIDAFNSVVQLLENYPYGNQNHFREWKNYVAELANYLENNPNESDIKGETKWFNKMVHCINGNQNVISSVSTKWYETLSGLFHFYIPTIKLLPEYLAIALEKYTDNQLTILEENLIYILENRIVNILPYLESLHQPSSAFVAALCEHRGLLPFLPSLANDKNERTVSSYMLYQLGLYLATPSAKISDALLKRLYSLAFGVLKVSNYEPYLRDTISELLPRYPVVTNEDMEYCLTIAAKWKLPATISVIYQRLGMELIHTSWLESMIFFSKSMECSDSSVSDSVGESKLIYYSLLLLEHSLINGKPVDNALVNQVLEDDEQYNAMPKALRQSLAPYRVLYRIFQLVEDQKNNLQSTTLSFEILRLSNELLRFQYLKNYQKVLLTAKIVYPLLREVSTTHVKFDSQLLIDVMESVNNLEKSIFAKDSKDAAISDRLLGDQLETDCIGFLKTLNKQLNQLFCTSII